MSDLTTQGNAFSIPDLLIRPAPGRYEGPQGYLLRLAEANFMTFRELQQMGARYDPQWLTQNHLLPGAVLDPDLHAHVGHVFMLMQNEKRVWNYRYARFCPACLAEDPTWRASWELMFHDACPRHAVWMVDQCSACQQPITWQRESLLRCKCGADLRQETSGAAPTSLCQLTEHLEARLLRQETLHEPPPLLGLDLEQLQRLIRYLGGYLDSMANPKPLKLRNAGLLRTSWPVSTLAAEVLTQWPQAFHEAWSRMQDQVQGLKIGLKGAFRQAHYYLYKGLKEPAFNPVRNEFETWLCANWKGTLSQRNWNLGDELLKRVQWIPGSLAAARLGISMQRLRGFIKDGVIDGQESISVTGRRFLMVRRDQLVQLEVQLANEMTLKEAMDALGLSKSRMQRLLKPLFPTARRVNNVPSMPWCVPRNEVETYLAIGYELPVVDGADENQVSLGHVLRFWAWPLEDVVNLIKAVSTGKLCLKSRLHGGRGITRWVFDTIQLRAWHANLIRKQSAWFSVPEVARILGIKQEVAYWLARNGYLGEDDLGNQAKSGLRLYPDQLEHFRATYVFATEIVEQLGISTRTLTSMLIPFEIYPLRGDSPKPCRQLVYRRDDIRRFLPAIGDRLGSDAFSLMEVKCDP